MTLQELKQLMGIAPDENSQDAILFLYLESAIQAAMYWADGYDWNNKALPLPAAIKLGILRYVELTKQRKGRSGVVSESIAGMSKTYASGSDDDYYQEAIDFWLPFRKKQDVVFRPAKRAFR
ncbi:phage head-tail connector protein [Metabacillus idriensis]|uniref:phage head-tail connector protein n=1 Tax=Metabacillus idriensis TaxID=324768 RepID=UPI00203C8B9F|nr:phage head-tail connector protein [Metabacillus idriensis]MCM3598705.1 phage head-tail connector protein [Metabacillus idriensis]